MTLCKKQIKLTPCCSNQTDSLLLNTLQWNGSPSHPVSEATSFQSSAKPYVIQLPPSPSMPSASSPIILAFTLSVPAGATQSFLSIPWLGRYISSRGHLHLLFPLSGRLYSQRSIWTFPSFIASPIKHFSSDILPDYSL